MNSSKVLNYDIRPCKYVERQLLLSSLYQIVTRIKLEYQYIGLGGVAFTDFKLFHKELNIDTMISIEGGSISLDRLEFNKPYHWIRICPGSSTDVLRKDIDLSKPSIVWLDYDGVLELYCFDDIFVLLDALPHGSVFIMSCNRELKNEENEIMTRAELDERFRGYTPFDLEEDCCAGINAPVTLEKMIGSYCLRVIKERNQKNKTNLKFTPLYNITYRDGAGMYTYGGIILNEDYDETELLDARYQFLNADKPLIIDIPPFTYKEIIYFNQILNDPVKEQEALDKGLITESWLKKLKTFYRYMPNFYDVRI